MTTKPYALDRYYDWVYCKLFTAWRRNETKTCQILEKSPQNFSNIVRSPP